MFSILFKLFALLLFNFPLILMSKNGRLGPNSNVIPLLNGNEIAGMNPIDMLEYDINNENTIYNDTSILINNLDACDQVLVAASKVSDFIPDFDRESQSKFWEEEVIPNLLESLTQDVEARLMLTRSLSSIRNLSLTIQKAWALLKLTKGSKFSVEKAQSNIPAALLEMDKCAENISKFQNKAIERFSNQTKQIFSIIGPEAAKFVEQKNEIEIYLIKLNEQQQKLLSELGERQGEVTKYNYMIEATEKHLNLTHQNFNELKRRTTEQNKLNTEIEKEIKNILRTHTKSSTTSITSWWFWSSTKTKSENIKVENQNRVSETKYYYNIISARIARLKENQDGRGTKLKVIKELYELLSEQKGKYNKALTELNKFKIVFQEKMEESEELIKILKDRIKTINKSEQDTFKKFGLEGEKLINCLVSVRTYAKKINAGSNAYAPMVSILRGIKAMVHNEVELLGSASRVDIFIASSRLLKHVKFFSSYSVKAKMALHTYSLAKYLLN